jgi:tripartite-type tricarboxylate transporter receptor subunit TctC
MPSPVEGMMGRSEPERTLYFDYIERGRSDPTRRRFLIATLRTLAVSALINVAHAADGNYPGRPVRLIVPVSTGSSGDVRVRLLAEKLSGRFGQRFVVENKPGGGTTLAAALVAKAKPDGYTLLATFTPPFTVGPIVYRSAGYDAQKSFTLIASFARASPILAVHPSVPAKTVKELVALALAKPGMLTVGHSGIGAGIHLPSEMFRRATKIDVVYVPYKSEAEAYPDLVGGQISAMFVYRRRRSVDLRWQAQRNRGGGSHPQPGYSERADLHRGGLPLR